MLAVSPLSKKAMISILFILIIFYIKKKTVGKIMGKILDIKFGYSYGKIIMVKILSKF